MAAKKKSSRRKAGTTVNFSGVESGGRRCPDGDYLAEIISAEVEESKAGNPMIVAKWKIAKGKFKGTTIYDQISLVPQALWKLKTLLEAIGVDPQEDDVEAEDYASEMMEQTATIVVTNETYEGEQRPKVTGYGTADGDDDSEEESSDDDDDDAEEEPKVRNKPKAGKKKDEEEEEDDDDDSEDDDSEDDDDAEADDEDDDEEEEKPKGKAGKAGKIKEGSRVKFTDDDDNVVKGTVTSLDKGQATVEDKNGDEYEIDAKHLTLL